MASTPQGKVYACWSFSRVNEPHPNDVFCVASHGAKVMALYALRIMPKGLICNDAGRGLDDSGIEGLGCIGGTGHRRRCRLDRQRSDRRRIEHLQRWRDFGRQRDRSAQRRARGNEGQRGGPADARLVWGGLSTGPRSAPTPTRSLRLVGSTATRIRLVPARPACWPPTPTPR